MAFCENPWNCKNRIVRNFWNDDILTPPRGIVRNFQDLKTQFLQFCVVPVSRNFSSSTSLPKSKAELFSLRLTFMKLGLSSEMIQILEKRISRLPYIQNNMWDNFWRLPILGTYQSTVFEKPCQASKKSACKIRNSISTLWLTKIGNKKVWFSFSSEQLETRAGWQKVRINLSWRAVESPVS